MQCPNSGSLARRLLLFFILLSQLNLSSNAQITEIYTDFGGYWKSTSTTINPVQPNLSNNVLAFTYNGVIYSTGVSDSTLTAHSITPVSGTYKALPISSIGGTVQTGNSTYMIIASDDDGVPNGNSTPLPSVRMNDVLTDGINGLDIGTGVTNIPSNASMTFPVSGIVTAAINDAKPDIFYTQVAATGGNADSLYFVTSAGVRVGNAVGVAWGSVALLGNYLCDLYNLTNNASCDAAIVTSSFATASPKEIRLSAFKLSEFGITSGNASTVATLKIKPGGSSDPAFVAYNADAFVIATPVITTQPQTLVVCPGTSQNATFSVTATGTSLTYQWRKNGVNISGATSSTYTITNVATADAGAYDVIVTNTAGSVQSSIAYLNTIISAQPSPSTQTIATGNSVTLSVTANNATGFQWKRNGSNISGATSSSYVISPLTTANGGTFTVSVINSANSGCATLLSSSAIVVPATTLYSKNTVLNAVANWTVNSDGSAGSGPVDFTRTEHIFTVRTNAATTANLTIAGTLDVSNAQTTITAGTTLSAGKIIRSGTTGNFIGSSTSNLTVGSSVVTGNSTLYFNSGGQVLQNLIIATGGNVTLGTALGISGTSSGVLTVNSGAVFNTSDSLTLKSNATGTALVGNSAGTITGKATVERYIPAKRSWRLMTAPLTNSATIYNSWQDSGIYTIGKGTLITGANPGSTTGMDISDRNNPSLESFDSVTQTILPITATKTAISPGTKGYADNKGYYIFVRGDRSPANTTVPNCNTTTLSCTGNLQTGTQTFSAVSGAGQYTFIGNPYASPIDFNNVTRTNLIKRFYTWDPNLNLVGGYVVLDDLDGDGVYSTSVIGSTQGKDIQSGQAFLVQTLANGTASLVINESSKSTVGNNVVFRPTSVSEQLHASLFLLNTDSTTQLADGAFAQFGPTFSDSVTVEDAPKFSNINETVYFLRYGKKLAIERRPVITVNDTLFLNVANTTQRSYRMVLQADNLSQPGLGGYLHDNYLNSNLPVDLDSSTTFDFTVDANPASVATGRFDIVFKPAGSLPVTFTGIQAYQQQNNIAVKWTVTNQLNIKQYQVERSADGKNYIIIGTVAAIDKGSAVMDYSLLDTKPMAGDNYYRVISFGTNGTKQYSEVVKVSIGGTSGIAVYPNPVVNGVIGLQLNNMPAGNYEARLMNATGQTILIKTIEHAQGSASQTIPFNSSFTKGTYELQVITPDKKVQNISLIY